MSRFFRRIFLSVWIILIATGGLTFFVLSLLPQQTDEGEKYDEQLVAIIANDLRDAFAVDPDSALRYVQKNHVLDFDNLLQIYVLDPKGNDVYGRKLPGPVSRAFQRAASVGDKQVTSDDPRIRVYSEGLDGFQVIGYQYVYPLGRALSRPGARLLLLFVSLVVSGVVSYVLARFIVLPVSRLREAGQLVAQGDLSVRVAHTVGDRKDDIAQLARDFDAMTERIEQLLSNQQRLMRDVSHELRSPLARMQALLSIARQKIGDDNLIDRLERESERLNSLIEQILSYARLDNYVEVHKRNIDLIDLLQIVSDDAHVEGEEHNKQIRLEGPHRLLLRADHSLLHSVFENVIRNAVRHTKPDSTVIVTAKEAGDMVCVSIEDDGYGVPDPALPQLFEPFYQVDEGRSTNGGSGVGLAIAKRGVQLHGGQIWAENTESRGLVIYIKLPNGGSNGPV